MTESVPKTRPIFLDVPITHISKQDKDRRVVAGYASFDVIDRQNEKITHEAMREALKQFMSKPEYANVHVMHGNCAVGKVIKSYTDRNGEIWKTKVDDTGTFIVSELRKDIKRANQTWELIEKRVLKSYSIGGLALNPKELICENNVCHWQIDKLEIHEFSYVDRPAVRGADFIIIKSDDDLVLTRKEHLIASMSNPSEPLVLMMNEEDNVNKEETPNPDTIIMPEPQAEPTTPETVEPEAKAKKAAPKKAVKKETKPEPAISPEPEATEKADAAPILLEIKGMLEKITAALAQKPEPTDPKKFGYPLEQLAALASQYGEEKSFHLLETIGDEAFRLITVTKDEEEAKPEEPEKEPEATEEETKPEEAEEAVGEVKITTEKLIEEVQSAMDLKVEQAVESTLAKYAQPLKRTLVPTETGSQGLSLFSLFGKDWSEVEAIAHTRGA